jgi:CHASE3 domain sensor protein
MRKKAMRNVSIMTELSTEKVELALVDDIEKAISDLRSELDNLQKAERNQFNAVVSIRQAINEARKVDSDSVSMSNKVEGVADRAAKLITKAQQAAKDLGIKQSDIKGVRELFNVIDDIDQKVEEIKNFKYTYDRVK